MRLPWPFGRAERSPSPDDGGAVARSEAARAPGAGSASGAAAPDASSPGASSPERLSRGAWRDLPPIAETVGPPPLVAPNRPFAAGLAAGEPPPPILAPLAHGRSLEAPKGIVTGIARPTETVAAPPLPAPVQRSPLAGRKAAGADALGAGAWEGDTASDPGSSTAAELAPSPIRHLDTVIAPPAKPAGPFTTAPEPSRSPLVGLVGQPLRAGAARGRAPGAAAPAPSAPVAKVQRAPAEATPEAPTKPATPPSGTDASHAKPAAPAPIAAPPRLTIGQARRLGLGAPIAGGPVAASAPPFSGPTAGGDAGRAAAKPALAVQRAPATGVQRAPDDGDDSPTTSAGPAALTPDRPVTTTPPSGPGGTSPLATLAAPVIARPLGRGGQRQPISATAPLVAAEPLRPRIQRAPTTLGPRDDATATPPPPALGAGPVKVHRDAQASRLSRDLDARSFTHGGEIYLPASHGPLDRGTGKALLAHELTHVVQQRRLGSGLPPEHTSQGQRLEEEAVAAERSASLPLAAPRASDVASDAAAAASAPATPTAPAAPTASHHAAGPITAGAQRAPARPDRPREPLRAGGDERPEPSDQELEDLAQKLYARIGRQLRREILVDRERAGMVVDALR